MSGGGKIGALVEVMQPLGGGILPPVAAVESAAPLFGVV